MMSLSKKFVISVIGGHDASDATLKLAEKVGSVIARSGSILSCGGLGGVMQAAARGAKKEGGLTLGILPGKEKKDANPYIDIAIPTTIGYARNVIVVCSADLVVALPGSHGTRSEISYALVFNRPVIDLGDWQIEGMLRLKSFRDLAGVIKEFQKKIFVGQQPC